MTETRDYSGRDVTPEPAAASIQIPRVRVVMRNYFSTQLLWSAEHQARMAARMESRHEGESTFDMEHRAYILAAI